MKPRVLFVSRTRYRLPLDPSVARKWDALAAEMELRVLAGGDTADDGRFRLVPGRSPAFYLSLPLRVAEELRRFRPDVVIAQSPYEASCRARGPRARALERTSRPRGARRLAHGDEAVRIAAAPARSNR